MATAEIDALLTAYGDDAHAINSEAQTKLMLLLREIRSQRLVGGPMRQRR
jgi:hypothetical protein